MFVMQIHPKVEEKDLFEFFSHVGRVEDIRLIRDQRTQKSKGLCYVEFFDRESVPKAVSLTGQLIGGYPIAIQHQEMKKEEEVKAAPASNAMKLYVGSLHFEVTSADLEPVFSAFGELDFIDIHKDEEGKSKGFGFVQYKNEADAKSALEALDGLDIAGRPIKVGAVETDETPATSAPGFVPPPPQESIGELDEMGAAIPMSKTNRAELMAKLSRGENLPGLYKAPSPAAAPAPVPQRPMFTGQMIQPSTCVVVKNVFDRSEALNDPNFDVEIKEDMEQEVGKLGRIKHLYVDKDSAGCVFIRMAEVSAAQQVVNNLNGRWFAQQQLTAEFVIEPTYLSRFPEAK